jgi:glycosyltransferase involved in cell wall biosynthesis
LQIIIIRGRAIDPAVHKICRSLVKNGHTVRLLIWDRQHTLNNLDAYSYTVDTFNLKAPYDKLSVIIYIPIWMMYVFIYLIKYHGDIIHACDMDTLIPAIITKEIKKTKLCYTIFDFYADILPTRIPSIIRKTIGNLEKFGITYTDALFLVDETRYEQINSNIKIKNLTYIYNSPEDVSKKYSVFTKNTDSGTDITIFYAGALSEDRGLKFVIKAIETISNVNLILAGIGIFPDQIEHITTDLKSKIRYVGWLHYEDVIQHTLEADILFAFYNPDIPNHLYACPNKLFEAMMCSKPIIVNDNNSMAKIVRTENCGLVIPYGDVNAIKNAIIMLKNDPLLCRRLGANGREAYEQKYSWKIMEERLLNTYKNVIGGNG